MLRITRGNKGFTLIELLVVIAIIGVLAAIVLVSLNQARVRARDARRVGDLGSVVAALELYQDSYGGYPDVITMASAVALLQSDGLLGSAPADPSPGAGGGYLYVGGGDLDIANGTGGTTCPITGATDNGSYMLRALLERGQNNGPEDRDTNCQFTDPDGGGVIDCGAVVSTRESYCVWQR